ncbi:TonB-dependent receptor [uncultured Bacteroides sp.]|uniref:TonB-dependent receptor n=1 Tax=uncultured Bacteroides sp. TaxID=162156 RepID=UPI002AA793F5|nr:TonB-dependent receptor [uncultured Bacteroides sp.]
MRAFTVLALLLFCVYSEASVVPSDSTTRYPVMLKEVVVTSSKEKKNLREIPASVSVMSALDLQNKNIMDAKDISAYIPNFYLPDFGSKLTSPVYIRGIGSRQDTPSIGLYVDGVPFFSKSLFDFDMNEVNKIEILRGPQGTLYGRNTMGGIINVYTKNPLDYQGLNYKQTVGNYGQTQFSGSYYGKASQTMGYSVSTNYKHNDGFFVNDYTGSKADNMNMVSSKAKLQWRASSRLEANLSVNYEYTDQGGYPYGLIDAETGKVDDVDYNNYSSYRQGVLTSGLTLNYSFEHFLLQSVTAYQNLDDRQAIDQDFTEAPLYFVTQTQQQHLLSQEVEMRSSGNKHYNWLNGVFGFYQKNDRTVKVASVEKGYKEPDYGIAVYHQSTLKDLLIHHLSLTAGLRFDFERARQDYTSWTVSDSQKEETQRLNDGKSFTQITPKVSLQYQFTPRNMVYVTTTKGYKTGGFNTTFSSEEERTFSPEYSWNYEIGSHFSILDGRIYGDMDLFYIDWDHQQISHPLATGKGTMLTNAGKSYSKGVELTLNGRVNSALNLQLSYGYTKAKFKTYLYGDKDYSGNYIPYVPNQTLMVGGDYMLRLHSVYVDRLLFSAQYVGTGKHYWNDDNSVRQGFYGVLNGKVSATKKNLTVDLWIKNATSRDYMAYYLNSLGNNFAQKGKPLTFGTTISIAL